MPRIIQFSMPRTGSTLVHQVLVNMYPDHDVVKAHEWKKEYNNLKVVSTYRDLRAVLISNWRISANPKIADKIPRAAIDGFLSIIKRNSSKYIKYLNNNNVIMLKYEDFSTNFEFIFESLEGFFGTKFSEEVKQNAVKNCSFDAHKKIADKMGHWNNWDRKTMIHGNHLYSNKPDAWKDFLTEEDFKYLTKSLEKDLKKWGYNA
jgi:hypothetical protein